MSVRSSIATLAISALLVSAQTPTQADLPFAKAEVVGMSKNKSRTKAYQLLRELGLKERYDSKPLSLSGGEQQRVAIARALVNDPMLVLADEPTGNLDADIADETMRLLFKVRDKGATIVVATHDLNMINRYGTRVVLLQRGALADDLRLASRQENGR